MMLGLGIGLGILVIVVAVVVVVLLCCRYCRVMPALHCTPLHTAVL